MRTVAGAVAVITGAGGGLGRALALSLAAKGAHLALADVSEFGLAATRAQLPAGTPVLTRRVDVADRLQVESFAAEVRAHFGRASLLINNAGVALYGRFDELSLDDLHWILDINFWGVVHGCRAFLPLLRAEPAANIVSVSSVFGLIAPPGQSGYAAAKFAVRGFSEALRHELEPSNVRLTVVHPGGIKTGISRASRCGAHASAAAFERDTRDFEAALRTPPEVAAKAIVRAVERDAPRLLIGRDARLIDGLQRALPTRYMRVLERIVRARKPS